MKTVRIKSLNLLVLLCGLGLPAQAQFIAPPSPGQAGFSFATEVTGSGDAKLKRGENTYKRVEIATSEFRVAKTFTLDEGQFLAVGLGYSFTDIHQRRWNHHHWRDEDAALVRVPLPEDLQSLGASLSYLGRINDTWTFFSTVGVDSNVAERGLLSDGWSVHAVALARRKVSETFTLAFGAAYNSYAEDWKFIPFLGFDWRLAEKWVLAFGFPRTGVTYAFRESLDFSLDLVVAGGTYHVDEDPRPGTAPRSLANSKLEYSEVRFGFGTRWRINPTFSISGSLGHVLYREFKYANRGFKLKSHDIVPFMSFAGSIRL